MAASLTERPIATLGTQNPSQGAFSPSGRETWQDATFPLGAHVDGATTTTFAVYSRNASHVLLEIYEASMGEAAQFDYWLERGSDGVWRGRLEAVPAGTLYAFRCWGANWGFSEEWQRGGSAAGFVADVDGNGNRFNPNKLLFE